jgi:hypothetical protein
VRRSQRKQSGSAVADEEQWDEQLLLLLKADRHKHEKMKDDRHQLSTHLLSSCRQLLLARAMRLRMRLVVSFSQLVGMLVGLFLLSFSSVVLLDLRFFLDHSTAMGSVEVVSASAAAGLAVSGGGGDSPGVGSDEEGKDGGELLFNNFADNLNVSVRKERQRDAPGMHIACSVLEHSTL